MSGVVRACDIGYGNTKYSLGRGKDGAVRCAMFPSFATSPSVQSHCPEQVVRKRDTVVVYADKRAYEVGPDVEYALGNCDTRILRDDYATTPEYLALLRGALDYMAVPEISLLMVGLPVRHVYAKANQLKERLTGVHSVGSSRTVKVHHVKVLPQPIGGFIDHAYRHSLIDRYSREVNLIIDPGYFTLDWVVARGIQMIDKRSGHRDGGVSAVVRAVAMDIAKSLGTDYTDFNTIERALRGEPFHIKGNATELSQYMESAKSVIDASVNELVNVVGQHNDIQNIVLLGGGAELFRPAIEAKFRGHAITVAEDPVYANVRGFHLAAEQIARRQAVA